MSAPLETLDDRPLYVISVAAELAGMHPQTLRSYDRLGLVRPGRAGRARRYSPRDVAQLREIAQLSQQEGVGLAGIARILALQRELAQLRDTVRQLAEELRQARAETAAQVAAALAAQASAGRRDLVPLRSQPGRQLVLWQRTHRR